MKTALIQTTLIWENPKAIRLYLSVKAYIFGGLLKWHQGFGGNAYIFADDIFVK